MKSPTTAERLSSLETSLEYISANIAEIKNIVDGQPTRKEFDEYKEEVRVQRSATQDKKEKKTDRSLSIVLTLINIAVALAVTLLTVFHNG